jgi:peptide/nickel transport system ATP-binding protein
MWKGRGKEMSLLRVEDLVKIYNIGVTGRKKVIAVNGISFDIDRKRLFALVGESGSGKTTIARIILRLIPPTSGKILFEGRDIFALEGEDLRRYRASVQAVFQDPYTAFNPFYKVDRALRVAVEKFLPGEDPVTVIREMLGRVKLNPDEVLGRYPHQLSGGQLQRMLIARALIPWPKLLVADEIISMVDMSIRIDILNLLRDLVDSEGLSVLFITHEMNLALYASDEIAVLYKGEIMEHGPTDEILKEPLHPYTRLLVDAIPSPGKKEKEMLKKVKEAEIERAGETSSGCPFYNRCPYAMPVCATKKLPTLSTKGRIVRCWLYT